MRAASTLSISTRTSNTRISSTASPTAIDNVELLKRYSTVGMGPSQGRHSAVTSVRVVSRETGTDIASMNVTTQRPPYTPEKFGHLAGRVFDPERRTAMHHRHLELGAQMMPAGVWWRPAYYGTKADRDQRDPMRKSRRCARMSA